MKEIKIVNIDIESLIKIIRNTVSEEIVKILDNQPEEKNEDSNFELLTTNDCVEVLKISKTTLWKLVKEGALSCRKVGSKNMYLKEDIENYIKNIR